MLNYARNLLYKSIMKIFPYRSLKHYSNNVQSANVNYSYNSHFENNFDFSSYHTDIKAIAYYLPQFHTFPENDSWWGKGFTEWSNTKPCLPRLTGHYEPREPHTDIGYYDLSDVRVMEKQAKLAKQHGIYGFCMYYYWFSGKKLMEKPLENLLKHPEINFPFCLCWANESWSRRWDGSEKKILIKQKYESEDPLLFIQDLAPYLKDKRYIKNNGKPIIIVYNVGSIPQPEKTFKIWRDFCKLHGIGEIEIWSVRAFLAFTDSRLQYVDREVEFPPHSCCANPNDFIKTLNTGDILSNYQELVNRILSPETEQLLPDKQKPIVRAAMLGWDNSPRHKNTPASIWTNYSLYLYYMWLSHLISYTRKKFKPSERFLFINAWNEWAEGTYLEPDKKYGYSALNTTSKALFSLPFEQQVSSNSVWIVCLESLGDIIACEPVIAAVQSKYPNRPVYWVTTAKYAELLEAHPKLAGIIPIYTMEQWQNLKTNAPSTISIVDLHFSRRTYYLSNGVPVYNNNRSDITDANYYNHGKSLLDIFSKVAGLPSNNAAPKFYITSKERKFAADLPSKYIVIHTKSSESCRDWDIEKWIKLIKKLHKLKMKIVEVGSFSQLRAYCPNIIDKTNAPSLTDTAYIISKASFFIGIDSAWAHAANALQIPGVILLGKYRIFEHYMPFSGYYASGSKCVNILYAPNKEPAKSLEVDTVLCAVKECLKEATRGIS